MAQTRGADGRWLSSRPTDGKAAATPGENETWAPRPEHCRSYLRERVAKALPTIVTALLEQAQKGSMTHAKGLLSMSGLDREMEIPAAAEKSFGEGLLEEWEAEK